MRFSSPFFLLILLSSVAFASDVQYELDRLPVPEIQEKDSLYETICPWFTPLSIEALGYDMRLKEREGAMTFGGLTFSR